MVRVNIGAGALLDINCIWFYYIARISQLSGGGILLIQIISTCLRCARGRWGVRTLWEGPLSYAVQESPVASVSIKSAGPPFSGLSGGLKEYKWKGSFLSWFVELVMLVQFFCSALAA
jgi:hypothetical protein